MGRRNKTRALFSLICAAIFVITKDPSKFLNRKDFELGTVAAVVNNCAMMTVLNNRSLFHGNLKLTSKYGIITVGGTDCKPTHIGTAQISICNDISDIITIPLSNTLYFPTSPVNAISIGKLSQYYDNDIGDDRTYIKSTCDKSWLSWDNATHHRTIFHPPSCLPELTINEGALERNGGRFLANTKNFFLPDLHQSFEPYIIK